MGVKACDRKGCEEIMCDRYSIRHGYICNSCFLEMKDQNVNTQQQILKFMRSEKFSYRKVVDLNNEFQKKR